MSVVWNFYRLVSVKGSGDGVGTAMIHDTATSQLQCIDLVATHSFGRIGLTL
jgi:hypothetical protein